MNIKPYDNEEFLVLWRPLFLSNQYYQ